MTAGAGDNRAKDAANQAIHSALLGISIDGARAFFFNIKGGGEMSLFEVNEAADMVKGREKVRVVRSMPRWQNCCQHLLYRGTYQGIAHL